MSIFLMLLTPFNGRGMIGGFTFGDKSCTILRKDGTTTWVRTTEGGHFITLSNLSFDPYPTEVHA